MMQASDGKQFGNKFRMKRYESAHSGKPAGPRAEANAMNAGPHEGDEGGAVDEANGANPEQMASEHGPAHEVHITHDHEGGKHHVHVVHGDGHEHHSDHPSADHAHHHAAVSAGVMAPPMEKEESEHEPAGEDPYESEPLD